MKRYLTEPRAKIAEYLADNSDELFTAAQIARALETNGISRSSVYRNLASMEALGQVVRAAGSSGEILYRFCGAECSRSLHLQCECCGKIVHLDRDETQAIGDIVASEGDFRMDTAKTVIYGRCMQCR